jgi:hypothetical protein
MSTASNTITISKCDNQLVMYAINLDTSAQSYQICNIQSGNSNAVEVSIALNAGAVGKTVELNGVISPLSETAEFTLPAGKYALVYTGLNWGAAYQFDFEFNGQPYNLPYSSDGKNGAVWNLGNLDITFEV